MTFEPLACLCSQAVVPPTATWSYGIDHQAGRWLVPHYDQEAASKASYYGSFRDHPTLATQTHELALAYQQSESDMASEAVQLLSAEATWQAPAILLYCHSTIDEAIGASAACRIQHELGLKQVSPFAVGQLQGTSAYMGLWLASSTLERSDDTALITCADKWLPPLCRWEPPQLPCADGAAAVLVQKYDATRHQHQPVIRNLLLSNLCTLTTAQRLSHACDLIAGMLSHTADIDPRKVKVNHSNHSALDRQACESMQWQSSSDAPAITRYGCADPIINLHQRSAQAVNQPRQDWLYWNLSPEGHLGAMLITL